MVFHVVRTEAFEDDLDAILNYLNNKVSVGVAERFYEAVDEALVLLAVSPLINAVSSKPTLRSGGYREHLVSSYVIIYRIDRSAVFLCRLFHQRQDIQQYVIEW